MSNHNPDDTPRKPSGSSSRSAVRSPSTSPGNARPQHKLTPTSANNLFGVGMGSSSGLKTLSSGWEVWASPSPTTQRNASVSSAASANDLSPSHADNSYRANLSDGWNAARPANQSWDDMVNDSSRNDLPPLEPYSPLSLHPPRQRQGPATAQNTALSAPRIDRSPARAGQYSPQIFEPGIGKEAGVPNRYSTTASPTKPPNFGSATFANRNGPYDALQNTAIIENDLSAGLRGMVVEDDYVGSQAPQYRQQVASSHFSGVAHPPVRAPPPMPHAANAPYSGYPQADYSAYYTNPTGRDPYVDYSYGYGNNVDPSLYASSLGMNAGAPQTGLYPGISHQVMHPSTVAGQQTGLYYDYSGSARPASQYFYPAQAVLYPAIPSHSPIMTPQVSAAASHFGDKKRDQYHMQQMPQNMIYPSIHQPSTSPVYPPTMDYGAQQIPMMMHGGRMYGPPVVKPAMIPIFRPNMRSGRRHDGAMVLCSPVLDEFKSNKVRKWEFKDIFGHMAEFSGDQHGSRFIQQKLETASSEEKQRVFDEIVPRFVLQLIQDVFGNYVVQKLFEHGTQIQKTILAKSMETHLLPLSLQMYGCRVVQKAIECILPDQQATFVQELEPHVLKLVKDANGNHVVQKMIERIAPEQLVFVLSFRGFVYDLASHPYGCRVLQRCLEHLPQEQTRPLLDELHKYTINLMQDQFGNYVVQFLIEHGKPHDRALVISKLRGQLLHMARHKFASNVCEKALVAADPEQRHLLIDEIMTSKPDGLSPIALMMKDQYGNYVLQRALAVVDADQRPMLIERIRPQVAIMRRYSNAYSKHLLCMERLLEKYSNNTVASE